MKRRNTLTPVEWEIMKAVYEAGESPSVRKVWEHAYPDKGKAYTTVQTIMNNLEKKGMLLRRKIGLVNFYSPAVPYDTVVQSEISRLTHRMFNDSVSELANHLVDLDGVTMEEIQKIRQILNDKEHELKEKNQ